MTIDRATARRFAALTLGHVGRDYPYLVQHLLTGPETIDVRGQHPIFHGSFDWHSCVHGWWQLLTLARLHPDMPEADEIRARADALFTPEKVAAEQAYAERNPGWERPYGWAWLIALHGEAARHDAGWATALEPFARRLAERFGGYIEKLTYPIRAGTHFNTAFACVLVRDWAAPHDAALAASIDRRAADWFSRDRGCQAWEPGGDEFLSSALCEALLMSRVLPVVAFADWFATFLPDLVSGEPATLFTPATVSDRSDGKIAHLDGLNLSRAWCWRILARELPEIAAIAGTAAEQHLAAALPHLAGDYMGEHWLATYALLAMEA
jgi:hypothetical protein